MRGYVSFLLVFVSVMLFLSLLQLRLASSASDLSLAVEFERAYGVEMNAKETALESLRQGGRAGFSAYDSSHSLEACRHCPDNYCSPPAPPLPPPPNFCDAALCLSCFRESEARSAAERGAASAMRSLHVGDGDFEASFGEPSPESSLKHDPLGRNGFALDGIRLKEPLPMSIGSARFAISSDAALPKGLVAR